MYNMLIPYCTMLELFVCWILCCGMIMFCKELIMNKSELNREIIR